MLILFHILTNIIKNMEIKKIKTKPNPFLKLNPNLLRIIFEYLKHSDLFKIVKLKRKQLTFIILNKMGISFKREEQWYDYDEKCFYCFKMFKKYSLKWKD